MNVAEYLFRRLAELGVTQAYCVPGGASMYLNDALGEEPAIAVRYMHHEQACAMAAEGYARTSLKPAVVLVTAGPGAINALNGVFGAYTDSMPMIVVSGQVRSDTLLDLAGAVELRQLGDQEFRTLEAARTCCKWVARVDSASKVRQLVDRALLEAVSGRPGPVWLEIPIDIQRSEVLDSDHGSVYVHPANDSRLDQVEEVLALLQQAQRPLILAGTGVLLSKTQDSLIALAEVSGIPVATAWSHDVFPNDHPLYAGRPGTIGTRPGNFAVQAADALLVLGSRLNIRQVSYNWESFAAQARIAAVDIDPAELEKPYLRIDIPINADLAKLLPEIAQSATTKTWKQESRWAQWIRAIRQAWEPQSSDYPVRSSGINPYHLVMEVGRHLKSDDVIVCGDATACIVPFQILSLPRGARMFSNSGCASMGYDLPAAIGSADAQPEGRTVCFAGDGSVMMNIQELATLARSGRNIILVILDNAGYLSIRQTQTNFFGREHGSSPASGLPMPDLAAVIRGFGLPVTELRMSHAWERQLETVLSAQGPRAVVAFLDPAQEFEPRIKSRASSAGIETPPLDEMFPFLAAEVVERIRRDARR